MIRDQKKITSLGLVPGITLDQNPFASGGNSARILRNFVPDKGRLLRKPFSPRFTSTPSGVAGTDRVWHIVDFKFTRNGAPQTQLLIFRSNGRVYKRVAGYETEIFPAATSFSALSQRPFVGQLNNRLFFSDGVSSYVYDGRVPIQVWGLARTTPAPAVSAVAGSLTAATGLKAVVTWVVLDETGTRVHESSRTDKSAFQVLSAQNLRIDITALSPPARATDG